MENKNFRKLLAAATQLKKNCDPEVAAQANELCDWFARAHAVELGATNKLGFSDFVLTDFNQHLLLAGIYSGKICEIGGAGNSFAKKMPGFEFEYLSLFPEKRAPNVLVADVTQCDHLPDASYDAVFL